MTERSLWVNYTYQVIGRAISARMKRRFDSSLCCVRVAEGHDHLGEPGRLAASKLMGIGADVRAYHVAHPDRGSVQDL